MKRAKEKPPIYLAHLLEKKGRGVRLLISWRMKWPAGVFFIFCFLFFYLLANHYPLLPPRVLKLSPIDQAIPFLPYSIWVYASELPFFIFLYVLNRCWVNMNLLIYCGYSILIMSLFFFYTFPVSYPRDYYPLPQGLDSATFWLFSNLRWIDGAGNCTPSLHVSLAVCASLAFFMERRKHFPWIFGWAILLSASTLTTKQHYLIDVILGALIGSMTFCVFYFGLNYRRPSGE